MKRIKFKKGEQRKFLQSVVSNTSSPSLRELLHFGISTNYSTLKNYYNESRTLPENLFYELCDIARINPEGLSYEIILDNWGKVKGGKTSKR